MGCNITQPTLNHVSNNNHVSSQKPALDDFQSVKHTYPVSNQARTCEGTREARGEGYDAELGAHHKNYLDHVYTVSDDLLEHYRYTAFGEVTIYDDNGNVETESQIDNTIMWNTRRLDTVSGYYLYKNRHYDPALGRWPSRDPIEEDGGVNLYAFVGNDPCNWWDGLGEKKKGKNKDPNKGRDVVWLSTKVEAEDNPFNTEAEAVLNGSKKAQELFRKGADGKKIGDVIVFEYGGAICCYKNKYTKPQEGDKVAITKLRGDTDCGLTGGTIWKNNYPVADANASVSIEDTCAKEFGAEWKLVSYYHRHPNRSPHSKGTKYSDKLQ